MLDQAHDMGIDKDRAKSLKAMKPGMKAAMKPKMKAAMKASMKRTMKPKMKETMKSQFKLPFKRMALEQARRR